MSRTCCQGCYPGQYHCRTVINFGQSWSDDTDNSFVPCFIVDDNGWRPERFSRLSYLSGSSSVMLCPGLTGLIELVNQIGFSKAEESLFNLSMVRQPLYRSVCVRMHYWCADLFWIQCSWWFPGTNPNVNDGFKSYAWVGNSTVSQPMICQFYGFPMMGTMSEATPRLQPNQAGSQLVKLGCRCSKQNACMNLNPTPQPWQMLGYVASALGFRIAAAGGNTSSYMMVTDNKVNSFSFAYAISSTALIPQSSMIISFYTCFVISA